MKLNVYEVVNENDFKSYINIISSFDVINPFYKIVALNYLELKEDKFYYFTLTNEENKVLILMPFFLRVISFKDQEKSYFDVSSPYGYSGPLFNSEISRGYLLDFWELVDAWYKDNNVITEFIRFSLNNNHHFYSGKLIPTLSNVRGHIIEEEKQWNEFKQKVRNNYRKSVNGGLQVKVFFNEICPETIKIFYDIYIKTMYRIKAEKNYFYSLSYFENIINYSKGNCAIAIVYKENVAISTELILISGDTLYSFLGGTLSEYFEYRPNDFLKIEVMKWARKNNFKNYILGGGRTDGDSLYNYKKSFFPFNQDVIYYTGRKIINTKVYAKLNDILNADIEVEKIDTKPNYFPIYRKE